MFFLLILIVWLNLFLTWINYVITGFMNTAFMNYIFYWLCKLYKQLLCRFVVREFTYNEEELAAGKNEITKLVTDKKKQFVSIITWVQQNIISYLVFILLLSFFKDWAFVCKIIEGLSWCLLCFGFYRRILPITRKVLQPNANYGYLKSGFVASDRSEYNNAKKWSKSRIRTLLSD